MTRVGDLPHYQFSSDLVKLAKHHVQFLQALHEHGTTLSRPSPESLRRYRDLWLPLVREYSDECMIPPADIAWLWHCHRLAPFRYSSYCKDRFGSDTAVEATPPFVALFGQDDQVFCLDQDDDTIQAMVSRTIKLWSDRYTDESIYLVETNISHGRHVALSDWNDSSLFLNGFDLLSSSDRQKSFLWQVSTPIFSDQRFLEEGLVNYHKFLLLKMNKYDMIIVPTYQIDLLWHTHILSSIAGYYQDCKAIIGVPMHHDDSLEDRSEGGPLHMAFTATAKAWNELYGEEYRLEGAMYRGEPPKQFFNPAFVLESKQVHKYFMLPLHGHPFNQVIGVQGASSTNPTTNVASNSHQVVNATPSVKWMSPYATAVNGMSGFIKRKNKPGNKANPMKPDYVFGNGPCGIGYYHVTTKESYEIMSKRIAGRIRAIECTIAMMYCCSCGSSPGPQVLSKEKEVQELQEYQAFVEARAKAKRPVGEIEIPVHFSISRASAKHQYRRQDFYAENDVWLFPTVLYDCGGGCGATGVTGGGCGGGGGGCGGGECCARGGGGGCCGGGCGGGGCGGGD